MYKYCLFYVYLCNSKVLIVDMLTSTSNRRFCQSHKHNKDKKDSGEQEQPSSKRPSANPQGYLYSLGTQNLATPETPPTQKSFRSSLYRSHQILSPV
ncbi:hypothetical protein L2E82_36658 [Cichorium intybus]|uniref:Uncharacterized protein n=1 Tax=Cichorium intybus TaxID=13427 RepID=A0ACB9AC72_CICIN|nr:hypothetical protein L2E82_36658 [Cichorium intybus]